MISLVALNALFPVKRPLKSCKWPAPAGAERPHLDGTACCNVGLLPGLLESLMGGELSVCKHGWNGHGQCGRETDSWRRRQW